MFRFAPSPNGLLHRGHGFSALLNQELARRWGGRLLLRIEDIDLARCSEANVDAIHEDLMWLGVRWDGPVRRQSRHFADYTAASKKLLARGLLYRCYASRAEIGRGEEPGAGRDPDGALLRWRARPVLDAREEERRRLAGEPFALRLDMRQALDALARAGARLDYPVFSPSGEVAREVADPARWGDVILVRKDTPTSYHLSVAVDDALQGVTHVVRGRDLEAATHVHRLLQALLDLPVPAYHHHDLVLDADGEKLAKSRGSRSLRALREAGISRDVVLSGLGFGPPPA
ncbi:tRNA glutamyl-Q(34) synthetase GluQRS [Pseudochelatococcus sp. B33]